MTYDQIREEADEILNDFYMDADIDELEEILERLDELQSHLDTLNEEDTDDLEYQEIDGTITEAREVVEMEIDNKEAQFG